MKVLVSWSSGKDREHLDRSFAGRQFERPVAVSSGEVVDRDGFVFADVL
jgi:hypothetical protein